MVECTIVGAMRYLDFDDRDSDMLTMKDWDSICDEAMYHQMEQIQRNRESQDEWEGEDSEW